MSGLRTAVCDTFYTRFLTGAPPPFPPTFRIPPFPLLPIFCCRCSLPTTAALTPRPNHYSCPPSFLSACPPPTCRVFLEERLSRDGAFTDALEADASELKTLMGLGNREAAEIEADVKQATYK